MILNKRVDKIPKDAVYVGRPSKYGNPFPIEGDNRDEVIEKYRQYLRGKPWLVAMIKQELRGKDLVCWCTPLACHADVLSEIANEP
jgi:hypothetical protein